MIALGHTNGEIAASLLLSVRTMESHRSHIQQKVALTTRAALVAMPARAGCMESFSSISAACEQIVSSWPPAVENLLGPNMHSTDRVLPNFQHPRVGGKYLPGANEMRLERVDPEEVLAWRSQDGSWVTFVVAEIEQGSRLVTRDRFRLPTAVGRVGMLAMEPASMVMGRRMLRGIKDRAERLAPPATAAPGNRGARLLVATDAA